MPAPFTGRPPVSEWAASRGTLAAHRSFDGCAMLAGVRASSVPAQKLAHGAAATLAVVLVLAIFHETAAAIVTTWYQSSTFNHAFLIIPICIYLAWQRREAAAAVAAPSVWGIAGVAMASLSWLVARVAGTLVLQELSLVFMVQSVILAMYGWRICRIFAFPLLYLFFAVPMGEALVPSLQAETARLAVALLRLSGIPVYADGNIISIPSGTFQVAEECSGVRFLIASLALGTLFAGLTYRSWWRRLGFVLLSCVVPVLANGVRAFGIIVIAYLSNNELAVGIDHVVYGWVFFTAISLLTLAIGMAMREKSVAPAATHAFVPPSSGERALRRGVLLGALALATAFAVQTYAAHINRPPPMQPVSLAAPRMGEPWQQAAVQDPMAPRFAAPDAQLDAAYVASGATVYLHIGYYLYERRGAEAVSYGHVLVPDKRMTLSAAGKLSAPLGGEALAPRYERFVAGRNARVVWFWYWVDGRFTGDPYVAKLLQAKAKILGGQPAAAIIAAVADYDGIGVEPDEALGRFIAGLNGLARTLAENR
jgi:exosortase A